MMKLGDSARQRDLPITYVQQFLSGTPRTSASLCVPNEFQSVLILLQQEAAIGKKTIRVEPTGSWEKYICSYVPASCQCPAYLPNFVVQHGYRLYGHVIIWLYAENEVLCRLKCNIVQGCLTFNYEEATRICELNDADHKEDLQKAQGFVYVDMKKSTKKYQTSSPDASASTTPRTSTSTTPTTSNIQTSSKDASASITPPTSTSTTLTTSNIQTSSPDASASTTPPTSTSTTPTTSNIKTSSPDASASTTPPTSTSTTQSTVTNTSASTTPATTKPDASASTTPPASTSTTPTTSNIQTSSPEASASTTPPTSTSTTQSTVTNTSASITPTTSNIQASSKDASASTTPPTSSRTTPTTSNIQTSSPDASASTTPPTSTSTTPTTSNIKTSSPDASASTTPPTSTSTTQSTVTNTSASTTPATTKPGQCKHEVAIGIQSKAIMPGTYITASTNKNYANMARLNGHEGWWDLCDRNSPCNEQWLQIYVGKISKITGIDTQGTSYYYKWHFYHIEKYRLSYSIGGITFIDYNNSQVLKGNTDWNTIVHNVLTPAITARYVRIHPTKDNDKHGWFGLRMELYECKDNEGQCKHKDEPIGIQNKTIIPDNYITAKTSRNKEAAKKARLNDAEAKIDKNQYGSIPNSNTTLALISMLHSWYKDTDGATVGVVLFDIKKAFDLIDHSILMAKLQDYDLSPWVLDWIASFLTDRKQRVKLSHDCFSEWGSVKAGVPQGTKLASCTAAKDFNKAIYLSIYLTVAVLLQMNPEQVATHEGALNL
ncbi:Polycystic kidney disease protein 1-like 3 [Exaiptasia diaphana]|nr:Polycystic kidney disease protein 1-like 3 [Exaiptasia diaphana]